MSKEEILKLLREAHETGYNDGWNRGKDAGISSLAIHPGGFLTPNKIESWKIFVHRLKFND